MEIVFLEEVDSTNDEAKRLPFKHGLCIVARKQRAGRGRRGRSWLSEAGKGLYASFILERLNLPIVSVAFGVAVLKTLKELDNRFYLKWPNDVYIEGKKVSGILVERTKDRLVVGVGINLSYGKEELQNLEKPATSLSAEGIEFNYNTLLKSLHKNVLELHARLKEGSFNPREFERECPLIGREVVVVRENERFRARALGIDTDGALIVERDGQITRLFSGEVSIRGV
jgi:BirA family biotin operon repressor/biotin-[acetyl-CoA-carboxylase] ligase